MTGSRTSSRRPRPPSPPPSAAPGWPPCHWRDAPAWPNGMTATTSWSCTYPPRSRTRSGPVSRRPSACRSVPSGSSPRTSAAGSDSSAWSAGKRWPRRPVRWIEDRQENLTAAFHGQRYEVRAAFGPDGTILALDAEIDCDTGAYSAFPFTCAVEPLMASTELPGVYKVPAYRARGRAIATNKAPAAPYRGVSRPQIVLVMERLMEKAAEALGLDPLGVRRTNLIGPGEFPYTGVNGITYDEGSYRESLDQAEKHVTEQAWQGERDRVREAGLRAGIGYACCSKRAAYAPPATSQSRMRVAPGYDTAMVRMAPTGEVSVTTGTCGHGQGHETTFAQIVADRLGVH